MRAIWGNIFNWDQRCFRRIFGRSEHRAIRGAFRSISHTADGWLYPLLPAALFLIGHARAKSYFFVCLLAFAIELPLYRWIKNGVRRARPFRGLEGIQNRVVPPDEFSFPSGHSSAAIMIAMVTSFYFPALAPLVFGWALLVGLSRVLLGVHYPTDVLAGYLLGSLASTIAIFALA